ncbi:MAG TPA: nucleotidyltransferase family protein, partial [Trebonia sp.]|nr:nucleotidyltransferase family protein [Trebonia sp.]
RVYAPFGLSDVFNLVARPNPVLAPRHVYQAKTDRWQRQWPGLTVLPWPLRAKERGSDDGDSVRSPVAAGPVVTTTESSRRSPISASSDVTPDGSARGERGDRHG